MAGRFLLDTGIAIEVLRNERSVVAAIAAADEVLLPSIAAGELL